MIIALIAIPATASATVYPMYWSELDGDPIDTVTVEVTGTIGVDLINAGHMGNADCQVTGEVELTNDWQDPTSPATQKITNIQPAGSVASSCTGWRAGCPITDVTYNSPWTGITQGYQSNLDGLLINMKWCGEEYGGGYLLASTGGTLDVMVPDEQYDEQYNMCVVGFDINNASLSGGGAFASTVNGNLAFDLDTLEGTEDGTCITLYDHID